MKLKLAICVINHFRFHMKNFFFKIGSQLCIFQLVLMLCQNSPAAQPVFTITPNAVSNTYIGTITFQITGIPAGHAVVIQKFGDVVTNGAIAAGDALAQQFNLTDNQPGMVIGGVTNFAVPFDNNSTTGAITAALNFPNGDFSQKIVGQYGFVLSSPVGDFTPMTNLFTVTNFPYAQKITGTVLSNGTSTALPYAGVILFPAPRPGHDLGTPVAGTVANNAGVYTLQVPPGTYVPLPFQSNYIASYAASPVVTVTNGQTLTTNLTMTVATAGISGKVVDALNSGTVLPGLFVPANNSSYFIATGSTDTNGNFTIRVTPGQWQVSGNPEGLAVHGYVAYDSGTNVSVGGGTTSFVGGFYKATSLFYGTIKDNLGNPLPGIAIEARDSNGEFDNDGYSDANGNYSAGAIGGLGSGDPWVADVDNSSQFPNYVFSQPSFDQNGGTNLAANQAVLVNFTALVATNQITGNVKFNGTNVVGVGVNASATINGVNYNVNNVDTDSNGNYTLTVANGNWNVQVYDCGCGDDDSLNQVVNGGTYQGNYQDPSSQSVTIANNNGTANFTVPFCGGVSIVTPSPLPGGTNGDSYYIQLQAAGCNNNFTWNLNDPADFPPGLSFDNAGEIYDTPSAIGTYHFSVNVSDGNGHSTNQSYTLYIAPAATPLQITTTFLPNGTNGAFYSQTLQASGGQTPYSWSIPNYSASLPSNLTLGTNGVLSGTPSATTGTYYFDVVVTDADANTQELDALPLTIVNPPAPPLAITNLSLPNGNVGAAYGVQLGATGGLSPYSWSLSLGSAGPPPGLSLNAGGLISGTPTTNGIFNFKVQLNDSASSVTNKVFGISINPKPVLGSPVWLANQFQMRLTGASNQNYTIQASTNLGSTNWISLFITNNTATNSFMVVDPNATNRQRFYRTLIGP
jgi:hypothetical protein